MIEYQFEIKPYKNIEERDKLIKKEIKDICYNLIKNEFKIKESIEGQKVTIKLKNKKEKEIEKEDRKNDKKPVKIYKGGLPAYE